MFYIYPIIFPQIKYDDYMSKMLIDFLGWPFYQI